PGWIFLYLVLKSGFNIYGVAADSWHKATLRFSDRNTRIKGAAHDTKLITHSLSRQRWPNLYKMFHTVTFPYTENGIAFQSLFGNVHDQNAQHGALTTAKRIAG